MTRSQQTPCAVVFDMDGILIDSEPIMRTAAIRAAEELGHQLAESTYEGWMGLPPQAVEAAIIDTMGPDFPFDAYRERFIAIWDSHTDTHGVPAQPGIAALLARLSEHGVPFSVATSTRRSQAERSLALAGLGDFISAMVTGDEVEHGKPAPDIFLRAAAAIDAQPARCIALEDSAVGVRAAAGAGMLTIMVPDLHRPAPDIAALARYVLPATSRAADVILRLLKLET